MLEIRKEISAVQQGEHPLEDSPLCHAPHTADVVVSDNWNRNYPREKGAYPLTSVRDSKYWPPVGRIDNVYGDKNLVCACVPISEYE